MAKILVARGQATINIQKDGYTLSQSPGEYIFPADADGKIVSAVSVTSSVKVTLGDSGFTRFSIGNITRPAGFSSISVNNSNKTITYTVAAGTHWPIMALWLFPSLYPESPTPCHLSGQRPSQGHPARMETTQ